jgi:hypothetical protein
MDNRYGPALSAYPARLAGRMDNGDLTKTQFSAISLSVRIPNRHQRRGAGYRSIFAREGEHLAQRPHFGLRWRSIQPRPRSMR